MSYQPVVRIIVAADWQRYRDVRLRALKESPDAFGSTYEGSIMFTDEQWKDRLAQATPDLDLPMTALVDEQFVCLGWATIPREESHTVHFYQMWVDPEFRGRGLGHTLMETALSWARGRGARTMELEVTCGDRPARRLYERLGFRATGEPIPIRVGSDLLEQTMQLKL